MPVSERECYTCGQKGHLAANCPKAANEVGQGGAEGVSDRATQGSAQDTSLGQPQPGWIGSVEPEAIPLVPPPASDIEWKKQYQETKRRNREEKKRGGKKFIDACCTAGCSHANDWDS